MTWILWFILGLVLAAAFVAYTHRLGARAERRVLAAGLVVAALVYVGFGVVGADGMWVALEVVGGLVYTGLAVLGVKRSPGWLAAGWALHVGWDAGLHLLGAGAAFAPTWYVVACLSFDLVVAGYIAFRFRAVPEEAAVAVNPA